MFQCFQYHQGDKEFSRARTLAAIKLLGQILRTYSVCQGTLLACSPGHFRRRITAASPASPTGARCFTQMTRE